MYRNLRPAAFVLLLPLLGLLAWGCADTDPGELDDQALPPTTATPAAVEDGPVPASTTGAGRMAQRILPLHPLHDSGISGEIIAMVADDAVVVIVELEGLPSEGLYPAHIHQGDCTDNGEEAVTLDPVPGLSDGTGMSTTTLEPSELDRNTRWSVRVHGEGGEAVACGALSLPDPPSDSSSDSSEPDSSSHEPGARASGDAGPS